MKEKGRAQRPIDLFLQRNRYIVFPLLFMAALSLIVFAARGDLWLDEIWSISFAEFANNAFSIFKNYKHDNNHILNTMYMYFLGRQTNLFLYRLLSVVAGGLSLVMLGMIARKWGRFESLMVIILAGTSYPLVLYFSEARGYAPAIFFSLLAFFLLNSSFERFAISKLILFWLSVILGVLSHALSIIVFSSLIVHSVQHELRMNSTLKMKVGRVISYNLVPSIFVIFFYFFFIRGMIIGGGDIYSKWSIVNQVAQLTLGFPEGNLFRYLALLTVLVIFLFGIYTMYRQHNEEWLFYVVVLSAAPVVLVLLTKPVYFQVRYLVLCIPFFYLLFCYVLGKCYRAVSFNGRWFVTVLLIVFVLGQSFRLIPLLRFGRGAFMEALLYISQNTKGSALIVGSDNDFRTGMVLHFYSRFLPKNKTLRYVEQDSLSRFAPTWFLTQSQNVLYRPPPKIVLKKVGPYRLIKSYPYSGISGSAWYLYRHEINE